MSLPAQPECAEELALLGACAMSMSLALCTQDELPKATS